jgi:hypothetical protein
MRPDLLLRTSLWLLLAATPALADDPGAPPREFWLYYVEFSDERGELLDPLDYSEAQHLPRHSAAALPPQPSGQREETNDEHER